MGFYGVVDRDADARLRRLVKDVVRAVEESGEDIPVADVADFEAEVLVR